ncbi:MAG: hypothetical protein KA472_11480 [Pseudomonadales bacterium]|nr:hypothetical protein [Pseudomonadales bacterium]
MTARLLFAALLGSTWFQVSAATVAALGALRLYGVYHQHKGANAVRQSNAKAVNDENALANQVRIRAEELAQERYRQIFREFGELPAFDPPLSQPAGVRQPARSTRPVNPYERSTIGK